jgi:hypothetical protein
LRLGGSCARILGFIKRSLIQGEGSQLVLKITQEVKLLLTYINRLYDGGNGGRTEVMKLMILEELAASQRKVISEAVVI